MRVSKNDNKYLTYIIYAIISLAIITIVIYSYTIPPTYTQQTIPSLTVNYEDGTSRVINTQSAPTAFASIIPNTIESKKKPVSSEMIWSEHSGFLTSLGYGTTAWKVIFDDGSVDIQYVKGNKLQLGTIYGGSNCQSLASWDLQLRAFDQNFNGLIDTTEATRAVNLFMSGSITKERSVAATQFNEYGCSFNPIASATPVPITVPTGTLVISSNPTGANFEVPGLGIINGRTPYTAQSVETGSWIVRITASGYNSYSTVTQVIAGQTTNVNVVLSPVTAAPTPTPVVAPPAPSASVVWNWGDSGAMYTVLSDGTLLKNGNVMGNYGSVSAAQAAAQADYSATHPTTPASPTPAPAPQAPPAPSASEVWRWGDSGAMYTVLSDGTLLKNGNVMGNYGSVSAAQAAAQADYSATHPTTTAPPQYKVYDSANNRQILSITAKIYINPVISGTLPSGTKLMLYESDPRIGKILSASGGSINGGFVSKLTNNELLPNVDNLIAERTYSESDLMGILSSGSTVTISINTYLKTVKVVNSNGVTETTATVPAQSIGSINVIKKV